MEVKDFRAAVDELARARGMSRAQVAHEAANYGVDGLKPATVAEAINGRRPRTPLVIAAVAQVLQVDPDDFVEFRLARARALLDERIVGLDRAAAALSVVDPDSMESTAGSSHVIDDLVADEQVRGWIHHSRASGGTDAATTAATRRAAGRADLERSLEERGQPSPERSEGEPGTTRAPRRRARRA